ARGHGPSQRRGQSEAQEQATAGGGPDLYEGATRNGAHAPAGFAACLMAARMRVYVPQRQMLPAMAPSMSASVGCGLRASSAAADMIWPDRQSPPLPTCQSSQACGRV